MDSFASSLSSFGNAQSTYNSGPSDGNYGNGTVGAPNPGHSGTVVAFIIIGAVLLLVFGVIGLRASGEVVI